MVRSSSTHRHAPLAALSAPLSPRKDAMPLWTMKWFSLRSL
nr:MAG TPA: hypothetical protein [Caudoviricetes sp.]